MVKSDCSKAKNFRVSGKSRRKKSSKKNKDKVNPTTIHVSPSKKQLKTSKIPEIQKINILTPKLEKKERSSGKLSIKTQGETSSFKIYSRPGKFDLKKKKGSNTDPSVKNSRSQIIDTSEVFKFPIGGHRFKNNFLNEKLKNKGIITKKVKKHHHYAYRKGSTHSSSQNSNRKKIGRFFKKMNFNSFEKDDVFKPDDLFSKTNIILMDQDITEKYRQKPRFRETESYSRQPGGGRPSAMGKGLAAGRGGGVKVSGGLSKNSPFPNLSQKFSPQELVESNNVSRVVREQREGLQQVASHKKNGQNGPGVNTYENVVRKEKEHNERVSTTGRYSESTARQPAGLGGQKNKEIFQENSNQENVKNSNYKPLERSKATRGEPLAADGDQIDQQNSNFSPVYNQGENRQNQQNQPNEGIFRFQDSQEEIEGHLGANQNHLNPLNPAQLAEIDQLALQAAQLKKEQMEPPNTRPGTQNLSTNNPYQLNNTQNPNQTEIANFGGQMVPAQTSMMVRASANSSGRPNQSRMNTLYNLVEQMQMQANRENMEQLNDILESVNEMKSKIINISDFGGWRTFGDNRIHNISEMWRPFPQGSYRNPETATPGYPSIQPSMLMPPPNGFLQPGGGVGGGIVTPQNQGPMAQHWADVSRMPQQIIP